MQLRLARSKTLRHTSAYQVLVVVDMMVWAQVRSRNATLWAGAFIVVAVCFLTACDRAPSTGDLLAKARQHESSGDLKTAEIELKNALQLEPNNAEARLMLGELHFRSGNLDSAGKELERALELNADKAKVMPLLARVWLRRGDMEKIIKDARTSESDEKEIPEILAIRGNAYSVLGKKDEAKQAYDRALAANPNQVEALLGQAKLVTGEKDFDRALGLADQALAKDPKFSEALVFKGDLLRFLGKNSESIALYRQAIADNPNEVNARLNLISLLLNAGNETEAQQEIDAARKLAPQHLTLMFMQGLLHHKAGRHQQSEEALLEVLRVAPEHPASLMLSGANQIALGHAEQAVKSLTVALAKAPDNLHARKLLASAYLANNQNQKAYDTVEAGLKRAPDDAQLLALGAEALTQMNELEKARDYFGKARSLDPNNPALEARLSASRLASTDSARAELEAVATLGQEQQQAVTASISARLAKREFDEALKDIETLQEKQPNNPLAYNLRGLAHLGKKDLPTARQDFERALKIDANYFPAVANLAQLDMAEKKPEVAKNRLKALLEKDKSNLQAMLALSNLAASTNDKSEAIKWLETAQRENPKLPEPLLAMARLHLQSRDVVKALEVAKEAAAKYPQEGNVLDLLGQAQLANKDADAALATYTKLTQVDERSPSAHYRLASVQAALGKLGPAAQSLKQALQLRPDYVEAMVALAALHAREGRFADAQQLAVSMQKRFPQSATGYLVEGEVLIGQKKLPEAAKAIERAYSVDPSAPVVMKLLEAQFAAGEATKAQAVADAWLKQHPDDVAVSQFLAQRDLAAGDFKAAASRYEAVLSKQPNNVQALNNYAWSLGQLKNPKALEYAQKAFVLQGENPTVLDTLGVLSLQAGKTERALDLLRKATDLAPEAAEIRFHYAQVLAKSGNKDQARAELERALESGQHFPEMAAAQQLLGELRK